MFSFLLFFCILFISSDAKPSLEDILQRNEKMIGVNTVRDKFNKNTIISSVNVINKNDNNIEAKEPDWSYENYPKEVLEHVAAFKQNMTECLKEVQASDKRPVKRLSPKQESPVHGECLIACVLRRNGVIEHGKINKGNLINLVSKFFAKETKLMKKLEKNLDHCIDASSKYRDECVIASTLNDCTNQMMTSSKRKITVNY